MIYDDRVKITQDFLRITFDLTEERSLTRSQSRVA